MHSKGTLVGVTAGTTKNHIIRASLEAIALQTEDVLSAMRSDICAIAGEGQDIKSLKVDGGASVNDLLMQMQSDFSGLSVLRSTGTEATATGAAFLAGLAVGFFESRDELRRLVGTEKEFTPALSDEERSAKLKLWRRAVRACRAFTESEED